MNTLAADLPDAALTPEREEIEIALARILADPGFERNGSATQFLKFVVVETLEGRGERLKGFTIATSALGRRPDFDPQSNSLVRVQASRLRRLLEDYYRGAGASDPVRIELPVGSYQPRFARSHAAAERASPIVRFDAVPSRSGRRPSPRRLLAIAATTLAVLGAAALAWLAAATSRSVADAALLAAAIARPPVLVIESVNAAEAPQEAPSFAGLATTVIEAKLSAFDHLIVARRTASGGGDPPDYALVAHAGLPGGGGDDVLFRLTHVASGEIVWSQLFPGSSLEQPAAVSGMIETVVAAVGDPFVGAVIADHRRRSPRIGAWGRGEGCIAAGYQYLLDFTSDQRDPVRDCLEREIAVDPRNSRAMTLLAVILLQDYQDLLPGNRGLSDVERMETLAARAFETAPHRIETSTVLFASRFAARRFDEAFELADRLLSDTSDSRLLSGVIAAGHIARGRYREGVAILAELENGPLGLPGFSIGPFALASYMQGDTAKAEQLVARSDAERYSMGLLMQIVLCGRRGDRACVEAASHRLRSQYPGFAAHVSEALSRHGLADDIKARLLAALRVAGFFDAAARRPAGAVLESEPSSPTAPSGADL